jgi:catechol 2,3-dioxygenase-like lactoylglutathione lyase family enzyme
MKIEKLDRVVVYVDDMEKSKRQFSELLGVEFDEIPFGEVEPMKLEPGPGAPLASREGSGGDPPRQQRVAISRAGLELISGALEPGQPARVACFHFKVADYEAGKAEMEQKGLPLVTDITLGTLREAIYQPEAEGPLMGLVWYDKPYVMDSIKTRG